MVARRHFSTLAVVLCLAATSIGGPPALAEDAPAPAPAPAASPAAGQAQPGLALDQVCAQATCRAGMQQIRLTAPDGGTFVAMTQPYPYADDEGTVIIFAGEAFEVSLADRANPKPQFVRLIPHVTSEGVTGYHAPGPNDPPPSGPAILSLELSQADGRPDMMLVLRNETGVPLKFDATMFVPTPEGMRSAHSSTCPVMPGTMGHEAWPHPVVMLVLTNFRRMEPGTLACE